jgi:curved DNA-binding protein CbpA
VRRQPGEPFAALGLDPGADLTDDDVRIAWRRIAAATHPDRADGGDPEAFAIAAAAYADLRTAFGRGEIRAEALLSQPGSDVRRAALFFTAAGIPEVVARGAAAVRRSRPARLAVRAVAAAAAATLGVLAAGPGPAGPALAAGAATWFLVTIRRDFGASIRRWSAGFRAGGDRTGRIGGPR